jgi:hypothetical protein
MECELDDSRKKKRWKRPRILGYINETHTIDLNGRLEQLDFPCQFRGKAKPKKNKILREQGLRVVRQKSCQDKSVCNIQTSN